MDVLAGKGWFSVDRGDKTLRLPVYEHIEKRERAIRFFFMCETKRWVKGVEAGEDAVMFFFIAQYRESIALVAKIS